MKEHDGRKDQFEMNRVVRTV